MIPLREQPLSSNRLPQVDIVGEIVRGAVSLAVLVVLLPFAQALETPYSGDSQLIVQPNGDGTLTNLSENSFQIPVNSTILDGWTNISTGANGDGGTGTHWIADDPSMNFSHGTLDDAAIDVFEHELTLGVNHTVGRLDDLEALSLQFQRYTVGGSSNVWRMAEPSQFNGPFAMNFTAREAAGGLIPSLATDGSLVAATLPEDPLPAGTFAWLTSPISPIPNSVNNWKLSFNHWYHLHHTNSSVGSSGAWLEVSIDSGNTWNYVEPQGGYNWNISTNAPVPNGASGLGFAVFGGYNASGWINSTFDITHLHNSNATGLQHRFVIWTDPTGSVDRPGWYVDEITISNDGQIPGSWFHGSLTGEYAADAHAHLTIPVTVNATNTTSGAWMIRYWADFDLEGGSWDNFEVEISSNNVSWYRMSPVGGIPGPNGLTISGQTIPQDSEGWVEIAHPFPSSFTMPSNGQFMIRIVVETDQMPSSGYGNYLDPPEGVFIDDIQITRTLAGITTTSWSENFTDDGGAWHDRLPGGSQDQWQHLTGWGNNGPSESTWSFENAPMIANGWAVSTPHGQSWAFGNISNASGWGPSAWPSGNTGVAMGLTDRHAANSWSHLISPSYHIPIGASARVAFDHFICAETGWDGGALYTSIDNGSSWQIYGQDIPQFYDVQHWNNPQSPFYQKWVWDGSNQKGGGCNNNKSFVHVEGDLSSFGGQDVMLRFSFFSDTFIEMDGWYIDNVGVIVDWFESDGSWTSDLILSNEYSFAPTIDIDSNVPDGSWVKASFVDVNGNLLTGFDSENISFPALPQGDMYRIRIDFGTTNHQLTPRIVGLHSGAVRILNTADATNDWDISPQLQHDKIVGNISNPTLNTIGISGSAVYGDAPIEQVSINSESAGVLYQLWDGQGNLLVSGALTNQSIVLPYAAVSIRPTIDVQPGGWIRHASFTGHLGLPMNNGSVDVGGDGIIDWTWDFESHGAFGWYDGHRSNQSQWAPPETILDQGIALYANDDITWTWANGIHDSMVAGEIRILERSPTAIQNQSESSDFSFIEIAASWESTSSITGLGQALRDIQTAAMNGTGPANIISGDLHIPIVLEADQGGVAVTGSISHAQRIVNTIISAPQGTMVPMQTVTIVTDHQHLFDRNLLNSALLRMHSNDGPDIEVLMINIGSQPIATQVLGAQQMEFISSNVTILDSYTYRIEWVFEIQWAFDDQDWIHILCEAIEVDGFSLGPGHAYIGGSNHQAMENDLEIIEWSVRDEKSRLLSNTWDARYPLHVSANSQINVTGKVRFEGQSGVYPNPDSFRVAIELTGIGEPIQTMGVSGNNGQFWADALLPAEAGNITASPWILQIGPPGTPVYGADDASAGSLSVEVQVDSESPTLGPLMIYTSDGGQLADENILSPNKMYPFWIEVHDEELLDSFVDLRCWYESYDDTDMDGIPDESEYRSTSQFLGGIPRGTIRVDFPAVSLSGMQEGDKISCYIDGSDFAGYDFLESGSAGFDNDLATMTVESQQPTQVSLSTISLDRFDEISLLMGVKHSFSFTLQDGNGLHSIDSIELDIAGDGRGVLHFHPLEGNLQSMNPDTVTALGIQTESLGDDAYSVQIDFAISLLAPSDWQVGPLNPSLIIIEEGEAVSPATENMQHLSWALDHRLRWQIEQLSDLSVPSMPAFNNRLNLQPGDTMSFEAEVVHRETGAPIAIGLPENTQINIQISNGIQPFSTTMETSLSKINVSLTFDSTDWIGPLHVVEFGLSDTTQTNSSLPNSDFEVAIDDIAPQIQFQQTSLIQLRSDNLNNQLVAFTIEDNGGMGEQSVELFWKYQRQGVDIAGASGNLNLGLGVYSGNSWVYSTYANFEPSIELQPSDIILVWVEGQDLAGNSLQGPGTIDSPRVPELLVIHFSPEIESVWIDPDKPEVGQIVTVDVRITNQGNLGGSINISLWAWEPQPNSELRLLKFDSANITLEPSRSVILSFDFEAWRTGNLEMYLVIDENETNRVSVNVPPIREEGASLTSFERIFGDGPIVVSLLILSCTGLGFAIAMIWFREKEEYADEEDWDGETEQWPEPPNEFPDQKRPPIPAGLEDVVEEEE